MGGLLYRGMLAWCNNRSQLNLFYLQYAEIDYRIVFVTNYKVNFIQDAGNIMIEVAMPIR